MITSQEQKIYNLFAQKELPISRLISYSKSAYRKKYPDNEIYFNANVFTEHKKIWYGDLDLQFDSEKLQDLANELKTALYVVSEMEGRFDKENIDSDKIKTVAQKVFLPQ